MRKNKLVYMLGFAPLLLGADNYEDVGQAASPLSVMALPKCGPDEFLSYQGAGLVCRAFSAGDVKVKDCSTTGQLLTFKSGGEFADFACADKGQSSISQTEITKIENLTNISTTIRNTLVELQANPPASASVYVGTAGNVNGYIQSGNLNGLAAASAICAGSFGMGARMCTTYELGTSVAKGVIKDDTALNGAWVYLAAWNTPVAGPEEPLNGMNENCATYTYPTGDKKWTGTTATWANTTLNRKSLKFTAGVSCNSPTRPIACCK